MPIIYLGSGPNSLTLRIHGRTKPEARDYWDANFLHCTADASVGDFRGKVDWQLRNEDLAQFLKGLKNLERPGGMALLDTGDGWLDIRMTRAEGNQIEARCELADSAVDGIRLEFRLLLDESLLPTLIGQLHTVLEKFPVVAEAKGQ
jgi:hypothetical protein